MVKKTDEKEIRITVPLDSARNFINEKAKVDINTTKGISVDVNPLKLPKGVDTKKYYYSWCEADAFPKWALNTLFVPVTPKNHPQLPREEFTLDGELIQNLRGALLFFALREKIMEIKNIARKSYEESARATEEFLKVTTEEGVTAETKLEKQTKVGFAIVGNE